MNSLGFIIFSLLYLHVGSSDIHKEGLGVWNGYEVKPHSIPFQAYLVSFTEGFAMYCGGSLISQNYILTVAHCILGADNVMVYLGVHNTSNFDENVQIFNATELYPHEKYKVSAQKVVNNIGVIKLPSSAQLTTVVKPGKLISESDYQSNPDQIGINATVSGWGKTGNPGNYSEVLRAGLIYIVDPTYCESTNPTYQNDQYLCIDFHNFENASESGMGDSGGPLFIVTDGEPVIVGLVSKVSGPEADTNVGYYRKWIAEHTDVVF